MGTPRNLLFPISYCTVSFFAGHPERGAVNSADLSERQRSVILHGNELPVSKLAARFALRIFTLRHAQIPLHALTVHNPSGPRGVRIGDLHHRELAGGQGKASVRLPCVRIVRCVMCVGPSLSRFTRKQSRPPSAPDSPLPPVRIRPRLPFIWVGEAYRIARLVPFYVNVFRAQDEAVSNHMGIIYQYRRDSPKKSAIRCSSSLASCHPPSSHLSRATKCSLANRSCPDAVIGIFGRRATK